MGNFQEDKKRGEIAEKIVSNILGKDFAVVEKSVGKNSKYDFSFRHGYESKGNLAEVKFDEMAFKTGNICFEFSNGVKKTGIFASESHLIFYVIPTKDADVFEIFEFDRVKLLKWIDKSMSLSRSVNGGDNNKFSLLLYKKQDIIDRISKIGSYYKWDAHQNSKKQ